MDMTAIYAGIIVVLICCSAFFSMSETAFTSVNQARLKKMYNDGNQKAGRALKVIEDYDKFITTILIGNNIVNIASTSIATMAFSILLGAETGALVSTVVMTLVILTCGEIIPKSLAKKSPERVCIALCSIIRSVTVILTPLSLLFRALTNVLGRIVKDSEENVMTEDELEIVIEEFKNDGAIESNEYELVTSALNFDDMKLSEVYISRMDMVAVPKDIPEKDLAAILTDTMYSRLPVYDGTIDNVIGMICAKEFFTDSYNGLEFEMDRLIRPVTYFPDSITIANAFSNMQRSSNHVAIVLDEHGGTSGMVTMEDLIETLLGDIYDEGDEVEHTVIPKGDNRYEVTGSADIYDVMDKIGIQLDLGEYDGHSVTGLVINCLGNNPTVGDVIDLDNVTIEVKEVDGCRVITSEFVIKNDLEE